jgi:hypothetical protein
MANENTMINVSQSDLLQNDVPFKEPLVPYNMIEWEIEISNAI